MRPDKICFLGLLCAVPGWWGEASREVSSPRDSRGAVVPDAAAAAVPQRLVKKYQYQAVACCSSTPLTTQGACHSKQKIAAVQHGVGAKGPGRARRRSPPGIALCCRPAGGGVAELAALGSPTRGRIVSGPIGWFLIHPRPAPCSDHSWPEDTLSSAFSAWNRPRFREHMVRRRGQL